MNYQSSPLPHLSSSTRIIVTGYRGGGSGTLSGGEGMVGHPGGHLGIIGLPAIQIAILKNTAIALEVVDWLDNPLRQPIDQNGDGIDDFGGGVIVDGRLPSSSPGVPLVAPPIPGFMDPEGNPYVDFNLLLEIIVDAMDDEAIIRIDTSPLDLSKLTQEELDALMAFKRVVKEINAKMAMLADSATLKTIFGEAVDEEVKALWSKVDYAINPARTPYRNGTRNGESDFNDGDPVVRLNIDVIAQFNKFDNGIVFTILHEFAHLLAPAQAFLNTFGNGASLERFTNDIARALGDALGLEITFPDNPDTSGPDDPGPGFSPDFPDFELPSPTPSPAPSPSPTPSPTPTPAPGAEDSVPPGTDIP